MAGTKQEFWTHSTSTAHKAAYDFFIRVLFLEYEEYTFRYPLEQHLIRTSSFRFLHKTFHSWDFPRYTDHTNIDTTGRHGLGDTLTTGIVETRGIFRDIKLSRLNGGLPR